MITSETNLKYNDYESLLHVFETAVDNHHNKLFIRYQVPNSENEFKTLTYGQADKIATQLASHWRTMIDQTGADPEQQKQYTVTIISEKSIHFIITFLAVIKLEMPFFSLSTSETEAVTAHFIKGTNTAYVIAPEKHHEKVQKCIDAIHESSPSVSNNIQIWNELDIDEYLINTTVDSNNSDLPMDDRALCGNPNNDNSVSSPSTRRQREKYELGPKDTAFYMHTSGSTALPKIIPRDARSILYAIKETLIKSIQQAGCPDLIMKSGDVLILPTARFPGPTQTTLLIGSSILIFGNGNVKSSSSLLFIAEKYKATLMICTPIALEHLAEHLKKQDKNKSPTFAKSRYQQEETMLQTLQRIKFCLSYGAPLRRSVGDFLRSKGLNVQNQCGSTESSILALSNVSKDNNKYWFSIYPTSGFMHYATFEPYDNQDNIYQLVLNESFPSLAPGLSNRPDGKYATKDLFFKEPEIKHNTWTFVGRVDDSINLSNGKKVFPTPMEKEIYNEEIVKNCIIIGNNRETVAVLVELHVDKAIEYSPVETTSKVYQAVHQVNKNTAFCTSIIVPDMVYILPPNKQLPTTRKKVVMRKKAIDMFCHEIEHLYSDSVANLVVHKNNDS
ncbi:hypothetical protein INT45_013633 [Circinella minor]|uniref:AMP-dependent synthetase/ligase domain-containing protein n=1 Tax=Circinella minor TaxID=1195481 RepID=A0A8H7VDS7_9FUNG|nr:hypothetical protein INT45_013633 [Circinella minor]